MNEIWRLIITDHHNVGLTVFGDEDVLRGAFDEIEEHFTAPDTGQRKVLKVEGYCDSADRASTTVLMPLQDVASAALTKM